MTELICNQGHVLDPGRNVCSRCGGHAIGTSEVAPVINEELPTGNAPEVNPEKVAKPKKAKVVKTVVVKTVKKGKKK